MSFLSESLAMRPEGAFSLEVAGLSLGINLAGKKNCLSPRLCSLLAPFSKEGHSEKAKVLLEVREALNPKKGRQPSLSHIWARFPHTKINLGKHPLPLSRAPQGSGFIYPFNPGLLSYEKDSFTALLNLLPGLSDEEFIAGVLKGLHALLSCLAPENGSLMLHASAAKLKDRAALFLGLRGGGKTTLLSLFGRRRIVADDTLWLKREGELFSIYDTPFNVAKRPGERKRNPLAISAMYFLEKSRKNYIEPVSPSWAGARLLANQVHFLRFYPKDAAERVFKLIAGLLKAVPCFRLSFSKDSSVASLFKEGQG